MARRSTPDVVALYADMPAPGASSKEAMSAEAQRTLVALHGGNSLRPDMAGTTANQLINPVTYQQKVTKMWESYGQDPLFMRLINRVSDFVSAGARWEYHEDPDTIEGRRQSWPDKIKRRQNTRKESDLELESGVWEAWSKAINRDTPNTPQGLDFIVRWAAKHCLLGGMFIPHWEWRQFRHGKKVYLLPMQMTCYPGSVISLRRPAGQFMSEDIFLMLPPNMGAQMSEYLPFEAPPFGMTNSPNMVPLSLIGDTELTIGSTEAFALKYMWSPGDLTTTRIGSFTITGWGQYPMPPFQALLPHFALRQKLFASDNALADGVAQYVTVFKVGNEKMPIKLPKLDSNGNVTEKGTLGQVRDIVEPHLANSALAIYLPWYVDMDYKMPNTETLMNEEKYIPSSLEILQAFGFMFPRSSAGRNESLEWINTAGFEQMLITLQQHVGAFMQRLVRRIRDANRSLKSEPTWTPTPPNTKTAEFRQQLLDLAGLGRISSQTLLENHNLNPDQERRRIASDLATGADDMFDDNVPMNNRQEVVDPKGPGAKPGEPPDDAANEPIRPPEVVIQNTNPMQTPRRATRRGTKKGRRR